MRERIHIGRYIVVVGRQAGRYGRKDREREAETQNTSMETHQPTDEKSIRQK